MATATEERTGPKQIPLRRLVILMLTELEIYEEDRVDAAAVKAYGWPTKYNGLTYDEALKDCTRVLLFGVLAFHCPSTRG